MRDGVEHYHRSRIHYPPYRRHLCVLNGDSPRQLVGLLVSRSPQSHRRHFGAFDDGSPGDTSSVDEAIGNHGRTPRQRKASGFRQSTDLGAR